MGGAPRQAYSMTPSTRNNANWKRMMTPLARSAILLSRSDFAASRRWTMVWSVPWLAIVRNPPPITPDQNVYVFAGFTRLKEKSKARNLLVAAAACTTVPHPPGIVWSNKKNAAIDPEK